MEKHIKIYKKAGETPLQRLDRLRQEEKKYADKKLSYAGRLDPMAEGVMLVLIGDENKERQKHLKYSKEYTFEVLFGFATDTYDLLGLVTEYGSPTSVLEKNDIKEVLKKFQGEIEQEYPPYSSKTVDGKALFEWAREKKLDEIEIPKHEVIIHELKLLKKKKISKEDLRKEIIERVMKVEGDFRQKEILDKWGDILDQMKEESFQIFKFNSFVSSGTYIRSLSRDMGRALGVPALSFSIKRNDIKT